MAKLIAITRKLFLLLIAISLPTLSVAQSRSPSVEVLVDRIQAPPHVNKELYGGVLRYIYNKIKPYQYVVEQCIRKNSNTGACSAQAMHMPVQEKVIESITLQNKAIKIKLHAYKKLGIRQSETLVLVPGVYDGTIIWQVDGSFFDLIPGKPDSGRYFCPSIDEMKEALDGRAYLIDNQQLKWHINNPKNDPRLKNTHFELKMVSIPMPPQTVFCTYSKFFTLSLKEADLTVKPDEGLWGARKTGFCRTKNNKELRIQQCPFLLETEAGEPITN